MVSVAHWRRHSRSSRLLQLTASVKYITGGVGCLVGSILLIVFIEELADARDELKEVKSEKGSVSVSNEKGLIELRGASIPREDKLEEDRRPHPDQYHQSQVQVATTHFTIHLILLYKC